MTKDNPRLHGKPEALPGVGSSDLVRQSKVHRLKILRPKSPDSQRSPVMTLSIQIDHGCHGWARIKTSAKSAKSVVKNPRAPPPPLGSVPGVRSPPNAPAQRPHATHSRIGT